MTISQSDLLSKNEELEKIFSQNRTGVEFYKDTDEVINGTESILFVGDEKKVIKSVTISEMGCNVFIRKPFTLQQLSQTIREIIDKK